MNAKAKKEMDALVRKDGTLKPEDVVRRARNKASALHPYFTWNDARAATKQRLDEAQELIRSYYIVVERVDAPPIKVRALVSLPKERGRNHTYRTSDSVLSDPDLYEQWKQAALAELSALQRKYAAISELAGVWVEIEKLKGGAADKVAA